MITEIDKDLIVKAIGEVYGVSKAQLKGRRRTMDVAHARFSCFRYLYEEVGLSLTQIGAYFKRHHSDVLYGIRKIKELEEDSRVMAARARRVRKAIRELLNEE
tara:strand:+ start:3280 stop:3588 length:309 start_codon:yes stop_codon:yes gene_type:complete